MMSNSTGQRGEQFPCVLAFRLDVAGKEELERAAAARGVTAGVLARILVRKGLASQMRVPSVQRAVANGIELRQLLGEVGKIGSNLNQIARALNSSASGFAIAGALKNLQTIEEQADTIRELTLRALRGEK